MKLAKITTRNETFLLSDYRNCPDDIDFVMYDRVISMYEELSKTGMPVVEDIFHHIEDNMINDICREIRGHIVKDNPKETPTRIETLTLITAEAAVRTMREGLEEEVMLILSRRSLCYKSFSMRGLGDDFGIINSPQQDIISCLSNGGDLNGYYTED